MSDYSYQSDLMKEVYRKLIEKHNVLLAACPGAGKTVMASRVIEKYRNEYPKANILILTHGQTILREQWVEKLQRFSPSLGAVEIDQRCLNPEIWKKGEKCLVALPQSIKAIKRVLPAVDLLVVDEAHHFYDATNIQGLLKYLKPKHQLLLTGTPSKYLNKGWAIVGVTIQELLKYNVLTDPHIEIVKSEFNIRLSSYDKDLNLRGASGCLTRSKINDPDTIDQTMDEILKKISTRLVAANPNTYDWETALTWPEIINAIGKTMLVCFSQRQATYAYQFLSSRGVKSVVSISANSDGRKELIAFRNDPEIKMFIVVNRGILGFDFSGLMNVIDMSCSLNPDRIFQLMCRVVRRNPEVPKQKKLFIKVAQSTLLKANHFIMNFVVAMSDPRYYYYSPKQRDELEIPMSEQSRDFLLSNDDEKKISDEPDLPAVPEVYTFSKLKHLINSKSKIKAVSYTNFNQVKKRLGLKKMISLEECEALVKECPDITNFRLRYRKHYEWIWRHGYLDDFKKLFFEESQKTAYSIELAKELIPTYKTKSAFREAHHGLFKWLYKNGHTDLLKFEKTQEKWTLAKARKLARKFNSQAQFRRAHPGGYDFLVRECPEALQAISAHIKYWTDEKAIAEAKKYESIRALRIGCPGAETYLRRRRLLKALFTNSGRGKRNVA